MFKHSKQSLMVVAVFLMTFLLLGSAAQARSTHGGDKIKQGAVIGAVVGLGSQVVRGNRAPGELLTGAAVGGLIGAGVGSYVDYKEERRARNNDDRYYDRDRRYDRGYYQDDYNRGYDRRSGRDAYRARAYDNNRAHHRHTQRCRH